MTANNTLVPLLHPIPGLAWTEFRDAAVDYARQGWPLVPGTYQLGGGTEWLGKRGSGGLEPVAELWQLRIITDSETALQTWTQRPYSLLVACGTVVDVLELPAIHGGLAQPVLTERGFLGPIAVSPFGSWLLFVSHGEGLIAKLSACTRLHEGGGWVPLPPTTRAGVPYRWRVSPREVSWRLPDSAAVQRVLIEMLPNRPC